MHCSACEMSIDDDPTGNISHEQKQNKQHTHTCRCGLHVEMSTFCAKNEVSFRWKNFPFLT